MKKDFIKYEDLTEVEKQDILRDFIELGEARTRTRWWIAPATLRVIRFNFQDIEKELTPTRRTAKIHRESSMPTLTRDEKVLREQVQILKSRNMTSGEVAQKLGWTLEAVNRLWI